MKKKKRPFPLRRAALTAILAAAGVFSFCAVSGFRYDTAGGEAGLQAQLTRKFVQVGKVWATTKLVSGVVSVLSSVTVEITPFGFGTSLHPLGWTTAAANVLDQISSGCLWALGAITVEKILLALSLWGACKIVIPLCVVLAVLRLWAGGFNAQLQQVLVKFAAGALALCCAVPVSLAVSYVVEESFLSREVERKLEAIEASGGEAGTLIDENEAEEFSVIRTIKNISASIAKFVSDAKGVFEAYCTDAVNYLMFFLVTNILIPLATVFGIGKLAKYGIQRVVPGI